MSTIMAPSPFGRVLGPLMVRYRMSQSELGRRAGVDHAYVSRILSGDRGAPSREVAEAMVGALPLTGTERVELLTAGGYIPEELVPTVRTLAALPPAVLGHLVALAGAMTQTMDRREAGEGEAA